MHGEQQIEAYLSSLQAHLAALTSAERKDISLEIGAHIRDSMTVSGAPAATVIATLGTPADLAAQYREVLLMHSASQSLSPLLILKATLRLASRGFIGTCVFVGAAIGYSISACLIVTAILKLFLPTFTGVWILGGHLIAAGTPLNRPVPSSQEILGWWYIPVTIGAGGIIFFLTSFIVRRFLLLSKRWLGGLKSTLSLPRHIGGVAIALIASLCLGGTTDVRGHQPSSNPAGDCTGTLSSTQQYDSLGISQGRTRKG